MAKPPCETIIVTDFRKLKADPPFQVNVKGVVNKCEDEFYSRVGTPMRCFKLHDKTGYVVSCIVFGDNTQFEGLKDGSEIVVYFANAQAALKHGESGKLWIYDSSHLVLLREHVQAPFFKLEINITST